MNPTLKTIALLSLAACLSQEGMAWALFGTSSSNAAGRMKSAERLLEKADTAFDAGKFETASNGYARVVEKLRVIESDYPGYNDDIASIRIGYCLEQMNQCASALSLEADATSLLDASSTPSKPQVSAPTYASGTDSAAEAFKAAAGENAQPVTGLDSSAEAENDQPEAQYNPRYLAYDFGEARELLEKGRFADAIDILLPMVKFDPDNRKFRMLLATARLGAGQAGLAIDTLEDLRGRREDLPLLLLISAAYTSAGRYPEALLALDNAAKLAPGEPDPYTNLAWLTLLMDGSSDESKSVASEYYKQALKRGAAHDANLENALGAKLTP